MSKRVANISEEKVRRIAAGATVAGVLLAIALIVVIAFYVAIICQKNNRKRELDEQIEQYRELDEKAQKDLDWYRSGDGLYRYARTHGYV